MPTITRSCGDVAQWLRAQAHEAIIADTGERAFLALRDWSHPIGWLYTRAVLPGLVDGWILADEYHDTYGNRPVILAGAEQRISSRGDLVLKQPTPVGSSTPFVRPLGRGDRDLHNGRGRDEPGGLRPRLPEAW